MNRQEILELINKIIKEEHGTTVEEDQLLVDCNIDSFGYAMLWLGIDSALEEASKTERLLGKKYVDGLDYKVFTIKQLIDDIEKRLAECI